MVNGFTKIRYGHGVAAKHVRQKRETCTATQFYKSPTAGDVVSSANPLSISWDTSCLNTTAVDIYLYAPDFPTPRIHEWESVDFGNGGYNTTLQPSWWNSTASAKLQLMIVPAGMPTFMTDLPAGPPFNATYTGSPSGKTATTSTAGSVTDVNNLPGANQHGLSKGKTAAAVIMTLLVVFGIAAAVYVRWSRKRGQVKRRRYSEAVDKRMSMISTEWNSVTTAGATAAIRNSMMVSEDGSGKRSSLAFGGIRPASTVGLEGGQAGIGAKGTEKLSLDLTAPHMAQLRPGFRASQFTAADRQSRMSRISFAPDTRPSSEYRRTRAFHSGYVPPLPEAHVKDTGELSPTQAAGPMDLTADDIRARISGLEVQPRASLDAMMPALSMMRTGGGSPTSSNDDMLISASMRSPPTEMAPLPAMPAPAVQASPVTHAMAMPTAAAAMSPDDMLRAYADRTLRSPPPLTTPAPSYNGSGMRTLYTPSPAQPTTPEPPKPAMLAPESSESLYTGTLQPAQDAYRLSFAPTEESRYGAENVDFGSAE